MLGCVVLWCVVFVVFVAFVLFGLACGFDKNTVSFVANYFLSPLFPATLIKAHKSSKSSKISKGLAWLGLAWLGLALEALEALEA